MPLYDCVLLLKPHVKLEAKLDLVAKVGKLVYRRNGVLTDMKSFGEVQLGYGIKKLDGKYYQGQLMQMTMMTPPSFNSELQYLNKEDRLLRWLLVKHRNVKHCNVKFGLDFLNEDDPQLDWRNFGRDLSDAEGNDDSSEDDDSEYQIGSVEKKDI